jgi:hypothetical protein
MPVGKFCERYRDGLEDHGVVEGWERKRVRRRARRKRWCTVTGLGRTSTYVPHVSSPMFEGSKAPRGGNSNSSKAPYHDQYGGLSAALPLVAHAIPACGAVQARRRRGIR